MINFFSKLDPFYFILSFAIGIFICYITEPAKKVVIKHPTPNNANDIIYSDNYNKSNCFKYVASKIDCPADKNLILSNPINID